MLLKEKLSKIQQEMKAPKNLRNSFGGYNYRNAESILEAFKPYEEKYNVSLLINDDIVAVGDRVYVKATAVLLDCESDENIATSSFAREAAVKKGMDDSQITGAASSYARKYALNGLFLLDDTKDADSDEYKKQDEAMASKPKSRDELLDAINKTQTTKTGQVKLTMALKRGGLEGKELADLTDDELTTVYKALC